MVPKEMLTFIFLLLNVSLLLLTLFSIIRN